MELLGDNVTMPSNVAVAGVGHLGKYLVEELQAHPEFNVVVLSRQGSDWLKSQKVTVFETDYSEKSVVDILDATQASALISFIQPPDYLYIPIHTALLEACEQSETCKRFIPSEWVGNVDEHPMLPRFYGATREPFRQILRARETQDVEWTLVECGWLADYFLPKEKTYMPPIPDEFPIDPSGFKALIRGTGDEPQSWTCGRDVASAVIELLKAEEWDPVTYIRGERNTFNNAVKIMESFYDRKMRIAYKSAEDINASAAHCSVSSDSEEAVIAQIDEWMISGASAVPREKTLEQESRFFYALTFRNLNRLLVQASWKDTIRM